MGAALEPTIVELSWKRLCIDLRLLGTFIAILGLVAFVLRYTGLGRWLRADRFGAVCVVAVPLILLAWTDPWHHLYWARLANETIAGAEIAIRSFGPGYWASIVYCYLLAALSTVLLFQAAIRFSGVYRGQATLMLFGVLLPWLVIQVVDLGMGIEPDQIEEIFNPFEQGGPASEWRSGGLGLGLAISRSIAQQHGGRLTASSQGRGMGATFTLEFPTVARPDLPAASPTHLPEVATAHRPLRILLVEDNKETLKYLSESLIRRGHDVRTASDLAHALRAVAESDFELLISDIELPDGSGLDLMGKLRSKGEVMGIAVSGFGTAEDISLSHSAGFARHLTKPFEFRRLEEAIEQVAFGARSPGTIRSGAEAN